MRIGVYSRVYRREEQEFYCYFFNSLREKATEILVESSFGEQVNEVLGDEVRYKTYSKQDDLSGKIDYLISIGGDGTLLDTLLLVKDSDIPVMGINLGRLGFLTSTGKEGIDEALTALKTKSYVLDDRTILQLNTASAHFGASNFALNEISVHRRDTSSMITIQTYINGEHLNAYWADGLMVASPTGSTGYSLSCGGPIINPRSKSFVITPVAAHHLNVRPIVIPDHYTITLKVEGRSDTSLVTLDSRNEIIHHSEELHIAKAPFKFHLVRLQKSSFTATLRAKMMWGEDQRN